MIHILSCSLYLSQPPPPPPPPPLAGADYNATILPVEFQMTQTQIPLIIPLIDDDILENTESFTVILAVTSGDSNVELGPRNETRITIIDNDGKELSLARTIFLSHDCAFDHVIHRLYSMFIRHFRM